MTTIQRLAALEGKVAELEEDKKKDVPEEDTAEENQEEKPADEAAPEETPAEPVVTPDVPEEETAEDGEDEKKDEDKLASLERRVKALEAENAKTRAMLRDPSFAMASKKGETEAVPASFAGDRAAPGKMTRAQAEAAYSKLKSAKERADFRAAHKEELGIR